MPDDPSPRRRITDRDRRRWTDKALDLLDERVGSHAEDIEELRLELRAVSRLPAEMAAMSRTLDALREDVKEDVADLRKDVRELRSEQSRAFERNFREHKQVKATADEIAQNVKPTRMSKVKDFVTYVSVLIVPFLLTYLTIVLARGSK